MAKGARVNIYVRRREWLDQLFDDRTLDYSTFKLGYLVGKRMTMSESKAVYDKTGKAYVWGRQQDIADEIGCNTWTVSKGFQQLCDRRHLKQVNRGNQVKGSNKYRLIFKKVISDVEK